MASDFHSILVLNPVPDDEGHGGDVQELRRPDRVAIDPERMRAEILNLSRVAKGIEDLSDSSLHLSELEFSLAITAKGTLALLGSGVTTEGKAAITVKFARKSPG